MREWEKNIRRVVPYVPGEQPKTDNIIKLNTNENPYPPAPAVRKAAQNADFDALKLYPDPTASELVEAIAGLHGVNANQIFAGVGSDDVLSMIFLTFFNSDKPILFPDITYSFYPVWADVYKIPYETQPVDEDFRIKAEDYYKPNGGVIITNPNAPTSVYEPVSFIEDIVKHNEDSIVVVDEAYVDFAPESAIGLLDKYDNVIIVRTFSKSKSMAGIRIGYAIASEELIKCMNDVKYSINSYTLNRPSIELGTAAIKSDDYYKETTAKVVATRERTAKRLRELGFVMPESGSNFLFAKHETKSGQEIFDALKGAGIYVRHWNAPRISDYLRITIGTDEQMDELISFLQNYLQR